MSIFSRSSMALLALMMPAAMLAQFERPSARWTPFTTSILTLNLMPGGGNGSPANGVLYTEYVCRATVQGQALVGRYVSGSGVCAIGANDRETLASTFDVLVDFSGYWEPGTSNQNLQTSSFRRLPQLAYEAARINNRVIYACRAFYKGAMHIGWTDTSVSLGCEFALEGATYVFSEYEVLVNPWILYSFSGSNPNVSNICRVVVNQQIYIGTFTTLVGCIVTPNASGPTVLVPAIADQAIELLTLDLHAAWNSSALVSSPLRAGRAVLAQSDMQFVCRARLAPGLPFQIGTTDNLTRNSGCVVTEALGLNGLRVPDYEVLAVIPVLPNLNIVPRTKSTLRSWVKRAGDEVGTEAAPAANAGIFFTQPLANGSHRIVSSESRLFLNSNNPGNGWITANGETNLPDSNASVNFRFEQEMDQGSYRIRAVLENKLISEGLIDRILTTQFSNNTTDQARFLLQPYYSARPVATINQLIDFGETRIGRSSTQQIVLRNINGRDTPNTVTITGAGFSQTNNCEPFIPAGSLCQINISFDPRSTGTLFGAITISSTNNPAANLRGVGLPAATLEPASLSFGPQQVGTRSTAQFFALTNYQANAVALDGPITSAEFPFTTTCPSSLAPNATCTFAISFAPTGTGTRSADFRLNLRGPANSVPVSFVYRLQGTGSAVSTTPTGPERVLPQFVFGGGWYSALYFTNFTNNAVSIPIGFFDENGAPLNVPSINGSSTVLNVPANGTATLEALNVGEVLYQGYARFNLPTGVNGYGVFRQSVPGTIDQEAVVPFSDVLNTSSTLTFDETNYVTAVALANPSTQPAVVTLSLFDELGVSLGTRELRLPAGTRQSFVLRNLPGLNAIIGKRGAAQVRTDTGAVSYLGLRFFGTAFTSIPTVVSGAPGQICPNWWCGSTTADRVLPQFVFGDGWYTALYFTNGTNAPVSFDVNLFTDAGQALTVPSLGAATKRLTIPAQGTAIIEAPNTQGGLRQGYARFTLPAGVLSYGVFRQSVDGRPDQEAVVPVSETSKPVSSITFDETASATAVAVLNPTASSAAINIELTDAAGLRLGAVSISLPANSKRSFLLRDEPALASMIGKRGRAIFTTSREGVSVLGLRFGGSAFTSIPANQ